jgi:hypothetical protein
MREDEAERMAVGRAGGASPGGGEGAMGHSSRTRTTAAGGPAGEGRSYVAALFTRGDRLPTRCRAGRSRQRRARSRVGSSRRWWGRGCVGDVGVYADLRCSRGRQLG